MVWLSVALQTMPADILPYTSFLKELKNMMTCNETSPGAALCYPVGSSAVCSAGTRSFAGLLRERGAHCLWHLLGRSHVAAHGPGNDDPVCVCLSAAFLSARYITRSFLYTLHRLETKIGYKHEVCQRLLIWKIDHDNKSSFFFLVFTRNSTTRRTT